MGKKIRKKRNPQTITSHPVVIADGYRPSVSLKHRYAFSVPRTEYTPNMLNLPRRNFSIMKRNPAGRSPTSDPTFPSRIPSAFFLSKINNDNIIRPSTSLFPPNNKTTASCQGTRTKWIRRNKGRGVVWFSFVGFLLGTHCPQPLIQPCSCSVYTP